MEKDLLRKKCVPCEGGIPPLQGEALQGYLDQVSERWRVVDGHHLEAEFPFPDFAAALEFVNRVGRLAEEEGHHPDLQLSWGRVGVRIWTHAIDGLSENDFILAAKIDVLAQE